MTRITAITDTQAQGKVGELFGLVRKKLGTVPNMMRTLGNSPAALEGYLNFSGALSGGTLPAKIGEQIALIVAEENQCEYCIAAHSVIGKMVGLSDGEIVAARKGEGSGKGAAAINFAREIVRSKGAVTSEAFVRVREAGLSESDITEIAAHVALNVLTNYFNRLAQTQVDFPAAPPLK